MLKSLCQTSSPIFEHINGLMEQSAEMRRQRSESRCSRANRWKDGQKGPRVLTDIIE